MTCLTCPACGRKIEPPADEILELGDLTLETTTRIVHAGRSSAKLSERQAWVLAELLRHPGQHLSVEQLCDASGFWGNPKNIKVHITRLRMIVGNAVEIRTHYGFGCYSIHSREEEPMAPAPPMTPAEIQRAVELSAEHPSSARVARLIGRSKDAVRRALRKEGVDLGGSRAQLEGRQEGMSETLAEVDEAMRIARQDWLEGHRRRKVLRAQL